MAGPSPRGEAARSRRREEPARTRRDDGHAPWLDEADEDQPRPGTLIGRSTLWVFLLGLLLLVSIVAAGVFMAARQDQADADALPPGASIPLLRDPGPWRRAPHPDEVQGTEVAGVGSILYDTGDGRNVEAAIDLDRLPEEPVALDPPTQEAPKDLLAELATLPKAPPIAPPATKAPDPGAAATPPAKAAPAKSTPTDTVRPRPATETVRRTEVPAAVPPPPPPSATATIQLGAFSSEARARNAWKMLSERFSYLSGLSPQIIPVAQDGRTLYRLRTTAPGMVEAEDICKRLKVAGESCAPAR